MKTVGMGFITAGLLLAGCTTRLGDFTVVSSKNMDIGKTHQVKGSRVIGIDKKHIVIVIPTGIPNMKEAVDEAIEKTPGAVGLSDVTIKQCWWYIPYIYGQQWWEVEGNPIVEVKTP